MADITTIIENSIREAEGTEVDSPDVETPEEVVVDGAEPVTDSPEPIVAESANRVESVSKPPEKGGSDDETAKALEELGIKAPKDGERENRLPYSRIKKIFGNAQKKWTDAHSTEIKTRDEKLTVAEKRLVNMDNVDRLIATDPDRYIGMLAALHPEKYGKYVGQKQADPVVLKQEVAAPDLGPRPKPDTKFEDGSLGYSPEQHEKLLDWVASTAEAKAVAAAEDRFTKRFGGIEQSYIAQQERAKYQPVINAALERVSQQWGKAFDDDYKLGSNAATQDQSEVLKTMKEHPDWSLDAAAAHVFLPKVQLDQNTQRAAILKEINSRKTVAAKTVPVASKSTPATSGEARDTEEVIREAIAAAGLRF
jgi:hypothetical protein